MAQSKNASNVGKKQNGQNGVEDKSKDNFTVPGSDDMELEEELRSEFSNALNAILGARVDKKRTIAETTKQLFADYAGDLKELHSGVKNRNGVFTELVTNYVKQQQCRNTINTILKCLVFLIFISILCIFSCKLFRMIDKYDFDSIDVNSLIALLSVIVTYVGSFIGVVEIITKYLFPPDEEKSALTILQTVIDNDKQTEDTISKIILGNAREKDSEK